MRRCVLCGRWARLAFQVEVGGFVCEAARLGLGGEYANEAARLVWPLGPAGFPEGSREKSISSSNRQNRGRPVNRTPAHLPPIEDCSAPGMDTTPGKHGEWRRRAGGSERCMPAIRLKPASVNLVRAR